MNAMSRANYCLPLLENTLISSKRAREQAITSSKEGSEQFHRMASKPREEEGGAQGPTIIVIPSLSP